MTDETRLKKIMQIDDLAKRFSALHSFCLRLCWHGGAWQQAMNEIEKMQRDGWHFEVGEKSIKAIQS